jgi:hypothetical protein
VDLPLNLFESGNQATRNTEPTMEAIDTTPAKSATTKSKPGRSYSVCEVTGGEGGKKKFTHRGITFIRETGSGGVLYFRPAPGAEEQEFALFLRVNPTK